MRKKHEIKVKRQPYYCEIRQSWVIPLTQGRETLVDANQVENLGKHNWVWCHRKMPIGYAELPRNQGFMHRIVMRAPKGMMVDHLNGNSLDNRKQNLRICTNRENQQNRTNHRSGRLVGASFHKETGKWRARIKIDGNQKHIGLFKTEIEAHEAYMNALKELAGN